MDVASQTMTTPHRQITILDAPGHRDFIPNMISGASQADCALLLVDAATGEFEAGFERGGQTREHLLLVRSLGVGQVIVAVNKLDQVEWSQARYEEICSLLRPFLLQSGFQPSKTRFVPVGAMAGVNLVKREGSDAEPLNVWYNGPTLVDYLGMSAQPVPAFWPNVILQMNLSPPHAMFPLLCASRSRMFSRDKLRVRPSLVAYVVVSFKSANVYASCPVTKRPS